MKKRSRKISNRVLQTELCHIMQMIDDHNFGYAKKGIEDILKRVMEYDLEKIKG